MMRLCELHSAYNCKKETCQLLAEISQKHPDLAAVGSITDPAAYGLTLKMPATVAAEPVDAPVPAILTLKPLRKSAPVPAVDALSHQTTASVGGCPGYAREPRRMRKTRKQQMEERRERERNAVSVEDQQKETEAINAIVAAENATKPFFYDASYSFVPQALKNRNIWLLFEMKYNPATGKFTKTPYHPISGKKTNDPTQGVSFEVARATQIEWNNPAERFVLGIYIESPLTVIDFDACRNPETGVIAPWVLDCIRELNSYAEISPSGTGVHVIVFAEKQGDTCKKGVEIYSTKRALTFTGVRLSESPADVQSADTKPIYERIVAGDFLQYYKANSPSPDESAFFERESRRAGSDLCTITEESQVHLSCL